MEDFFVRGARIDSESTIPEVVALLKHIVNTNSVQKALPDVLQVNFPKENYISQGRAEQEKARDSNVQNVCVCVWYMCVHGTFN